MNSQIRELVDGLRPRGVVAQASMRVVALAGVTAILAACGAGHGPNVRVTIPPGATMRVAAESLSRANVISFARGFRLYASLRGNDRGIRAGTYLFHRNASWSYVLDALRAGKGLVHIVTIPEGFSLTQIESALETKLGSTHDSIVAAGRDSALRQSLDLATPTLEGYLFPDTYVFPDGTTPRAAVAAMVRRFEQVWKPEWTARLDTIHLSRNEVMTLASLVEKEARVPEERPVIAAVYLNRLRQGELLQADPTVQYALGKHVARVFYKDLEVESPYNTYKHKGLPPGPIASPGKPSIEAALYPATVPFKYFVAFPDGHHEFRADLASHERAVALARRAWDSVDAVGGRRDTLRPK
ncbi:MAG TPA: endolytic transglycosylase MltG [Gemmatimonadaceae bacterium]|nr:endolytic transglycosylase MltG [Gemmatimonadaceae bacterium]